MKNLFLSFVLNLNSNIFTSLLFFLHWKRHWGADLSLGTLLFCRHLPCLLTHPQVISLLLSEECTLFIHYSCVSSSLLFHHTLLVLTLSLNSYRKLGWVPSGSDKIFWIFILSFIPWHLLSFHSQMYYLMSPTGKTVPEWEIFPTENSNAKNTLSFTAMVLSSLNVSFILW